MSRKNPLMGPQSIGEAYREKYWKELKSSEKIERMREIVKGLKATINFLESRVSKLQRHSHNERGEAVLVEGLEGYFGGNEIQSPRSTNPDEVYF